MTQKLPENLPADLPENWQTNEIISPEGTEVGLTPQHGYNYLMKQVNDAQKSINNIVSAFGDVAQQSTSLDILNKIGNPTDTRNDTIFGKQNNANEFIKNALFWKFTQEKSVNIGSDYKKIPFDFTFNLPKESTFEAFVFKHIEQNNQYSQIEITKAEFDFGNAKIITARTYLPLIFSAYQKGDVLYISYGTARGLFSLLDSGITQNSNNITTIFNPACAIPLYGVNSIRITGNIIQPFPNTPNYSCCVMYTNPEF